MAIADQRPASCRSEACRKRCRYRSILSRQATFGCCTAQENGMKLHGYFDGLFTDSVNLNPTRLDQLAAHEMALRSWLRDDPGFGPVIEGLSRQGSWANRTIIKPMSGAEFDADLLVRMARQRSWSKDPARYLEALHEAMPRSPRHWDKVELKTRCVRVTYAGDCHVDLVPYVHVPLYGIYDQQFIVNRKVN